MTPEVSVIMPTSNRRMFARQAIKYFERYTGVSAEMIIVDGGSSPVPERDLGGHPRIRRISVPSKMTIGEMLNTGIRASKSKIIARQDDDDWYSADRLERLVEILRTSKSGVVGTSVCLNYAMFLRRVWKAGSLGGSYAFRREVWEKNPFPDLRVTEDVKFLQAVQQASGERCSSVPESFNVFVHIRHFGNVSGMTVDPNNDPGALAQVQKIMGSDFAWYESFGELSNAAPEKM